MLGMSVVDQFDVGSEKSLTTKGTKSHEGNTYKLIPSCPLVPFVVLAVN